MKSKILPLELNARLEIECWTYYKFAIIQTLPEYMNWVSSHMSLYYNKDLESLCFGNYVKPHPVEYFADILDISELDLYEVPPQTIVEHIKQEIDQDYYFVVFLRDRHNYAHEIFVYGYDDEAKTFHTIALTEDNHHFTESIVTYEQVLTDYTRNYEHYIADPTYYYSKSAYGYVMSRIKPRDKYLHKNYAMEFFDKISIELYGTRLDQNFSKATEEYFPAHCYYTGINCLLPIRDLITAMATGEKDKMTANQLNELKKNLFKLCEHRFLTHASMKWHEEHWGISDDSLCDLREQYYKACQCMRQTCYWFLKFMMSKDTALLPEIADKLSLQYRTEHVILEQYVPNVRQWYMSNVLQKRLQAALQSPKTIT